MRVGVIVPTADSDIAVALSESLIELARTGRVSPTLFYENPSRTPENTVPTDHHHGLFFHRGILVATTYTTAAKALMVPATLRILYCWDCEWVRADRKEFHALNAVYGSPQLVLVAGTRHQQEVITRTWGRRVAGFCGPDLGLILETAGVLQNKNSAQ